MLPAWLGRLRIRAQSLRVTITLSFILLVLLTAGSIGYITLQNSQRGHEVLGDQFLYQIELNVRQRLDDYLAMPHMLNRYNAEEIKRDPTVLADLTALRPRYLRQLLAFDPIMTVAIGIEQSGEIIGVGRRGNDTYDSGVMDRRVDNTYRVYLLDRSGNIQGIVAETPNYDARTRPWYQAGVKAGKAAWSPVYVWASQQNIGITAVLPIYDDAGSLLGVHQSALSLKYIGQFLSTLRIGRSGQIFLMERSGWLIGTSIPEEPVRLDPAGTGLTRIKATESTDAFTRAAAEHLMTRFPDLQGMPDPYRTHVDLAGKSYFLIASPFSDPYGLDWVMVIGVPEADFM
ncbi:MAG: cache domain-containing protein, partial [Anaerolineae bacterium]